MSRLWLAVAFMVAAGVTQAHAAGDLVAVVLDQAKVAKIPPGATTIILGNPMIADVTMLKDSSAFVITGKAFGQTNLIAIDAQGTVIEEKQLRVVPAKSALVLQSGASRISYACNPDCMPTVQLGDDNDYFSKSGSQITMHNSLAEAGASSSAPAAGK